MRWPWRRSKLHRALTVHRVNRYRVRIRLNEWDAHHVLRQGWTQPVLDYYRSGRADGSMVVETRVSSTTKEMATAYVRRQLERCGVVAISVETC